MGRDSYSDISGFDSMNTVCLSTSKHIFGFLAFFKPFTERGWIKSSNQDLDAQPHTLALQNFWTSEFFLSSSWSGDPLATFKLILLPVLPKETSTCAPNPSLAQTKAWTAVQHSERDKRMNWLKTLCHPTPKDKHRAGCCIIPGTQNPRASTAEAIPMRNCSPEEMGARNNSSTKLYSPPGTWKNLLSPLPVNKNTVSICFFDII